MKIFDSNIPSLLRVGFLLFFIKLRSADVVPIIRLFSDSPFPVFGAFRLLRMFTGMPVLDPGVYMVKSTEFESDCIRCLSIPQFNNPVFHVSETCCAYSFGVNFFRRASSGLIHGSKSVGCSSGKCSKWLVMSPFGSIIIAGTLSMAASSSKHIHRPVFPLPVIPTHTACVVKSRASYCTMSSEICLFSRLYSDPRKNDPSFSGGAFIVSRKFLCLKN